MKPFAQKQKSEAEKRQMRDKSLFFDGQEKSDDFQFVEKQTTSERKSRFTKFRGFQKSRSQKQQPQQQQQQQQQSRSQERETQQRNNQRRSQPRGYYGSRYSYAPHRHREPSIVLSDDLPTIATVEFAGLAKKTITLPYHRDLYSFFLSLSSLLFSLFSRSVFPLLFNDILLI